MLRVISNQAVKAVPRPRLGLHPPNGTPYQMQSLQAPVQRLGGSLGHQSCGVFQLQESARAKDRAEYIDTHDIGPDPKDHGVLISGVDDEKLPHEIAKVVGIPYHAEATKEEAKNVVEIGDCYLYGPKLRTIFPTVGS